MTKKYYRIIENMQKFYLIEFPKFKEKNPECNTKLEQWLWLIDGSKEEKVEMSAKENEEIDKAVELNEEDVKAILNEKKQKLFAIAKDIHNQCIRKNIKIIDVGADILIAGTAIINSKDYAETIKKDKNKPLIN